MSSALMIERDQEKSPLLSEIQNEAMQRPEQHTIHCPSSYLYDIQINNAAWCSKTRKCYFLIFHFHIITAHNISCYPPILHKYSIFFLHFFLGWLERNLWRILGAKQGVLLLWAVWKWGILDCRGGVVITFWLFRPRLEKEWLRSV